MLMFAGARDRHGHRVRIVPGAAQHATRSRRDAEEPGRSAGRRQGRTALPHHAGDRANRVVDGAPGAGRIVCEEPVERQPRRSRPEGGSHGDVRPGARTQRLQHRADAVAFERVETEVAAIPGVTSVAAAVVPVLAGDNWGRQTWSSRASRPDPIPIPTPSFNAVGPGYFRTMGMPLMTGQ